MKTEICRSCGSKSLSAFLSLGRTPLANALLREEDLEKNEPRFPLDVAFCGACSLVQILETVPPEVMFSEYLYLSSFSTTMVEHARLLAEQTIAREGLGPDSLVIEAASNDGYLLQWYAKRGIPVLGVEPAKNIALIARDKGIATDSAFFGLDTATALADRGSRADVVHAHNVLAHVPDLNDFVAGFRALLKPGGLAIIEVPYVVDLVHHVEFDTIYHEHLSYFSLTALDALFTRQQLAITDAKHVPIHGGSLQLNVRHAGAATRSTAVLEMLRDEKATGVDDLAFYADFGKRVDVLRTELVSTLRRLKADGKSLAAYGASAKGSTLLNSFGIGRDLLEFAVDRSSVKQGRYMPGVHLPIVGPERLEVDPPDYLLLLTWNFADEILEQQKAYRDAGGKFIIPLPEPRIV
jgi:SAM-dependent methyltransferase